MDHVLTAVKAALTAAGGFLAYWLGGLDALLKSLIALMVIDYITGLACAWFRRKLSSEIGFKGIVKKTALLGAVAVAFVIQDLTGGALPLRELTIMFFVANEGLSVLENMAAMGVPFPDRLREALAQLRGGEADGSKADSPHQ